MLKILQILQISTKLFTKITNLYIFTNTKVIKNAKLLRIKLIKTALVFGPDGVHRVQTQEQF